MDDITAQFEEVLLRHLRLVKQDSVDYDAELAQLGLDSMTAVAVLLDMEKTFGIRFPDEMLVEGTFRTGWKTERSGPTASRAPSFMTRPLPDQSLGPEWAILELLARGVVDDSERHMVRELVLSDTLDWGELLEQALRHKMLPMLAHHIISGGLSIRCPDHHLHALGISLGVESLPDRGVPT